MIPTHMLLSIISVSTLVLMFYCMHRIRTLEGDMLDFRSIILCKLSGIEVSKHSYGISAQRFEEIVSEILDNWWKNSTLEDRKNFLNTPRDQLAMYHHGMGTNIRNHFKLWENKWIPELDKDNVDISPDHPDAISMRIIKEVYDRLQIAFEG